MEEKRINFDIKDGEVFFAHELSVNFNPTQFVFDFRSITPRVDPRSNEGPVIAIKHNVVLVEPHHAKKIAEFLLKKISDYEKNFGSIEKPKALKELEKKYKKGVIKKREKTQTPTYFG
jgi:hypothetical protein